MRPVTSVLTLTLALGLAACDAAETSAPLAPESPAEAAATPVNPGSHGAMVTRDSFPPLFIHFDADRGLMSVHGGYVEFCHGVPGSDLTPAPRLIVDTPSQISQRMVKVDQVEEPVVVYRTATGAFSCALVLSQEARVASGMVRHNQVFTAASFTSTWRGTVMGPDGSTHHLTEKYQLTGDAHDPNNSALWSLNASTILIQ
jgi:hypothetical protein